MPQTTACPSCQRKLVVPDELLGKSVRCPNCETVFTAATDSPAESVSPTGLEEAPGSERIRSDADRARRESDDRGPSRRRSQEEDDDYYDGPEYGGGYGRGSRRGALNAVAGPATALQVAGGISLALSILGLLLVLVGVALPLAAGGAGPKNQNDQFLMMFQGTAGIVMRILGIVLSILVLNGARKMKRLESRSWAMAASIIAMIPCTGCCLLGMPFGIWSLVVLNKPEVRDSFR
jgi:predicted Zn finger-like uncharacterized protein